MHEELETRLRAARDALPGPDPGATARVARGLDTPARRPWRWIPLRRVGVVLAMAAVLALVAVLAVLFVAAPKDRTTPAAPHWRSGDVVVPDLRGRLLNDVSDLVRGRAIDPAYGGVTGSLRTRAAAARRVDGVKPGTILDQTPPPGTSVAEGTYLRLTVAVPTGPGGGAREQMPDFSLQLLPLTPGKAHEVSLASLRGRIVVLAFTASWCKPCVAEIGALPHLTTQYNVLAIATNDTVSGARSMRHEGQTFPLAVDPTGAVLTKIRAVATLPATVVLDREGRIAARFNRSVRVNDQEIVPLLEALRAEQPARVEPGTATPMGLSVERTPPIDPDEVPDWLLTLPPCEIDQTAVWRLATSPGGTSLYVARVAAGGFMVATWNENGLGSGGCGGAALGRSDFGFGTAGLGPTVNNAFAIIPDGYTEATINGERFPIAHNGLVLDGPYPSDTIVHFSGPAGTKDVPLVRPSRAP